jgi:hypothetical protein
MLSVKIVAITFIPNTLAKAMAVTIAKIVMQSYHSVRTARNEIARLSCQLLTADTESNNGARAVHKTMLGIVTDVVNLIAITIARIIYEAWVMYARAVMIIQTPLNAVNVMTDGSMTRVLIPMTTRKSMYVDNATEEASDI